MSSQDPSPAYTEKAAPLARTPEAPADTVQSKTKTVTNRTRSRADRLVERFLKEPY